SWSRRLQTRRGGARAGGPPKTGGGGGGGGGPPPAPPPPSGGSRGGGPERGGPGGNPAPQAGGGGAQGAGNQRGPGAGPPPNAFAEIRACRRACAADAGTPVDGVEVQLENAPLAERALHFHRVQQFAQLARRAALATGEERARELLRQRACATQRVLCGADGI